jgi:hypothetical protein
VDVMRKILYLRQNYHFRPTKISMYLARYHDVCISDRRWRRSEKQPPGHQVQINEKFIAPLTGPPSTSTRLRVLRIYPRLSQRTAIQFADHVLEKLPFQVQRSRPTAGPSSARRSTTKYSTKAAATATSSPAPHGSAAKWRDHYRINAEEFYGLLDGAVIDDAQVFNPKLQEWEDYYYNFHRPHGCRGSQTPYERLRQQTPTPG